MSASPVLAFQKHYVVLIASPDPQLRVRAGQCFNSGQWKAESVSSGAEAIVRLESRTHSPIVLLIDRGLPDLEPVELSNFVLSHFPEMHVCIMDSSFAGFTPHAIPGLAPSHLLEEVLGRLQPDRPDPSGGTAMPVAAGPASLPGIVSKSAQIAEVARLVRLVSRHKTSVLLQGETGTGKELVARALHELSPRHHHPFVAVNCAAIPEALMESELFGHLRGAFTGALQSRPATQSLRPMCRRGGHQKLAHAIADLPERERKVLALYHHEELTMKEIGSVLGIGESRISQIHSAAIVRLRFRMGELLTAKAQA